MTTETCAGCDRPLARRAADMREGVERHVARGCCNTCYTRLRRHGDAAPVEPYVDDIAVERAISGDAPDSLTPRERLVAVDALTRYGLSARLIAERVGCTPRTVTRHRTRARIAA